MSTLAQFFPQSGRRDVSAPRWMLRWRWPLGILVLVAHALGVCITLSWTMRGALADRDAKLAQHFAEHDQKLAVQQQSLEDLRSAELQHYQDLRADLRLLNRSRGER